MNFVPRIVSVGVLAAATTCLGIAVGGVASADPVTNPAYPGVTCDTLQMATRDGTKLTTYVYQSVTPGRYPVIVQRNPYGYLSKDDCFTGSSGSMAFWAQNGYVGVQQEVRGTYNSEGIFNANVQEAKDGYDAIEWAAAQSWSNGKVGTTGGSYLGLTQWQPIIHRPPHLLAAAPAITTSDLHDDWLYDNGVFLPWGSIYWIALTFQADQIVRKGHAEGLPQEQIDAQVADWNARYPREVLTSWVWTLDFSSFPLFRGLNDYFYDWVSHPNYAGYWESMDVEKHFHEVEIPTFNSSAWYDPFQIGTFSNYVGMHTEGGSRKARRGAKLVVGAYGHSGDSGTPTFGSDAVDPLRQLRFFDHYVKGLANGFENEPSVNLYVLVPPDQGNQGSGFWVTADEYPLPGTRGERFYLDSKGHANSRYGDGRLIGDDRHHELGDCDDEDGDDASFRGPHSRAKNDIFIYDPHNPVPTVGGAYLNGGAALLKAGAADQSTVETRDDVLVYTSAPLEKDLPVVGMVKVEFWAATSARDTDFTAKLVDVHVDGFAQNVLDRVVRARFREGHKKPPKLVEPNKPLKYTLDVGNAGMIFPKGHRIRLEISSSNFPRVARNLNTGAPNQYETDRIEIARQKIFHSKLRPSFLELPVARGVRAPNR